MYNRTSLLAEVCRREDLLNRSTLGHAVYILDATGAVSMWSPGALATSGHTADEVIGRHFSLFYTAEDRENGEPERNLRLAAESGHYECEGWRISNHGTRFRAHVAIEPICEEGQLIGFAALTQDISRRHEVEEQLAQAKEQLARANRNLNTALTSMWRGLVVYDASGRVILANRRLGEMFSISTDSLRAGMSIAEATEALGFSRSRARQISHRLTSQQESDPPACSLQETQQGRIIAIATRRLSEGGWLTICEDVTERQQAELKLEHQATHDPLTGLANRTFFRRRLDEAVARMKRGIPFALLVMDIKHFSSINDVLGEAAGDELLRSMAQRIKKNIREVDTVARLDGDKFAILQFNPETLKDTEELASRLMECFSAPYCAGEQSLIASVNVGIALGTSDGFERDELLKNADLALRRAKQSLLPCYSFFNAEIDSHLRARRALENELYEASKRGEFTLHYQPIADARTGQITGCEALLRWWHSSRGWVPPAEFVPVAEECGLIVSLGAWVLRTACAEAAGWPSDWHVAVNLSAVQFQDGLLLTTVAHALSLAGLEPHRLELEITESVLLKDNDTNLAMLAHLREMGVHISLDDFGTGYSSLSYLRSFRFDKLKIDRSFVQDLAHSDSAKAIVNSVIGLGKSFGVSLVAEGVETQEQLEYLQQHGCDEVQGYLLGRPQPPEELGSTGALSTDGCEALGRDSAAQVESYS
jgi:diguanylate cyclase (GGDEF)-like protein/PAS domain S-box-containing protein